MTGQVFRANGEFLFFKEQLGEIQMANQFRICISSPPDREKLVGEIFFADEQWAEVSQETGSLEVESYPRATRELLRLSLANMIESLNEARHKLRGG